MAAVKQNYFSDFTNLYSLSKTLRFELKPMPQTEKLLKEVNLDGKTPVQIDEEIDKLYHFELKPLFDKLHEIFITEALKKVKFKVEDLKKLEELFLELKTLVKERRNNQDKIDKIVDEIVKLQSVLRISIVEYFNELGEQWKKQHKDIRLDDKGYRILTNAKILEVLLLLFPDKKESIKKFQGFFTYFSGLNQNRENYYSEQSKTTSVANRIINENFVIFTDDKQIFVQIAQRIPILNEYKKYFELENYENYLTQETIENFNENIVGKINSEKNLFLQQENSKPENKAKKIYLSNLKALYKQIGCRSKQEKNLAEKGESIYPKYLEKVGLGFQITKDIQGKYQIWQALEYISDTYKDKLEQLRQNYRNFFSHSSEYNLQEVWFRKESINTISARWFGGDSWSLLSNALKEMGVGKIEKGEYKTPSFISLEEIKQALNNMSLYEAKNIFKEEYRDFIKPALFETFLAVWQQEIDSKFDEIQKFIAVFGELRKAPFESKKHIAAVKNLIEDGYLRLYQLTKFHSLMKKGVKDPRMTDGKFYDILEDFWKENEIVTYHKAFQATLTKKPYSDDKIKLNFENGSLLGGFSDGQEKNKSGVILRNGQKYYLGILRNRGFFRTDKPNQVYQTETDNWQRLILTNLKFQTLAGKGFLGQYINSYGDIGKEDPLKAVSLLQEYIKNHYVLKYPQLGSLLNKKFSNKKEFDAEIKKLLTECFTMKFVPINYDILNKGLEDQELYLFEITNKDFSEFSKGKNKNLHTLYWEKLFVNENLAKPILALNGGAELFFRKGQKEKLQKKKDNSGKEILNNKRYSEDKYFIHVSITINYGKPKNIKYRDLINQAIKNKADEIKIIGIDRGEKNLLYYSVVDAEGAMIDKGSLNVINDVDYNAKLQERQNKRNQARLNWEEIGNIKNFKEGYLSQAIYKVYELIVIHNAIVVMEDLNTEFKAKRMAKVEKSIYKKFELALAKKLNHLILKSQKTNEKGGVLQAYQLTPLIDAGKVGSFERAKQWGVIFYVRANYTSITDPLTGWRKHQSLYISNSETIAKIQAFFNPKSGIKINYDPDKKCYKFDYINDEKQRNLYAFNGLERFRWNPKTRKTDFIDLYKEFHNLFFGLDNLQTINQQIIENKKFEWGRLVFLWNLLTQIRNTDRDKTGNDNDFIQSPIWSEKYQQFFDSRKVKIIELPDNGDANGAYNIARKGAILLKRIKECQDMTKFDYYISDVDWDNYVGQLNTNFHH